jgi:hypothetical protein
MSGAAQRLIEDYDALPAGERQEVLAAVLRRAALEPHEIPSDEELVAAAELLFQDLDRREQHP